MQVLTSLSSFEQKIYSSLLERIRHLFIRASCSFPEKLAWYSKRRKLHTVGSIAQISMIKSFLPTSCKRGTSWLYGSLALTNRLLSRVRSRSIPESTSLMSKRKVMDFLSSAPRELATRYHTFLCLGGGVKAMALQRRSQATELRYQCDSCIHMHMRIKFHVQSISAAFERA